MKRKNTTRNALFTSVISLLLCVSMLVGTTFAWFTDEVVTGMNTIAAGNLDVELFANNNKVEKDTKLFNLKDANGNDTWWEPGMVVYENLQIKNVGTLALKYQMSLNFGEENDLNGHKLSEVLKVAVLDKTVDTSTMTRAQVLELAEASSQKGALSEFTLSGELEAGVEGSAFAVVIYWTPNANEVDNLYNANNGQKTSDELPLHIAFGVNLQATQKMSESDSFGKDYDKGAAWDGTVPTEMPETLVVDGETQTIHVKDAAAFAYLSTLSAKWADLYTDGNGTDFTNYANGEGENYYYSNQWTISLESDLNLMNQPIDPVAIKIGQATGATAFVGNGHVISNINTTTGLFADHTSATFSNLVLKNVKATRGALIGAANHAINNVTVENATISGVDYVGGLVGSLYSSVSECKVIDSSVVASGKEAGGMIGYAETSTESAIVENTVTNVTVSANNRAAGLVAQANVNVKVNNNTVNTVTVKVADTSKYQPGAVVSNALDSNNVKDNTVENVTLISSVNANVASLKEALENSNVVVLQEDITVAKSEAGSNGYGATGIDIGAGQTLDGNGKSLGVDAWGTWDSAINTTGGTIKNLTVNSGMRGIFISHNGTAGKVYLDNVIIDGTIYTISCDQGTGKGLEAKNSTFNGWTSYAATIGDVKFENCSFGEGQGYAFCRPYAPTEFVGCKFAAGYELDACAAVSFKDCTIGGVALTAENLATLVTGNIANATVK